MFGTSRPRGVAAAMPRSTKCLKTISPEAASKVALTSGVRRAARHIAFATTNSGETSACHGLVGPKALDELDRAAHVDGQELGDVRGGERARHHRLGRHATHAA